MKRIILLSFSAAVFVLSSLCCQAHERDYNTLKGLSFGVGLPFECKDLPGAGMTFNIGYDCAYPINDQFALGFYLTGGGGFWGEYKQYSNIDHFHPVFRLTAGLI